jgi:aquaporin SIP
MGLARKAVADASITFLWVAAMASLGAVSSELAPVLGLDGPGKGRMYLVFGLVSILIFSFSFLGQALGGASWNPTALVAFAYAGASKDDLFTLAVRMPAQMAGAVGGALTILEVMPKQYKHTLGGPRLKVPLQTGVIAETLLTFTITLIVMWAILRGPRNRFLKTLVIIGATITLVVAGGAYTGPAMNPANAFGWAFVSKKHTSWEHFAVYWAGPMIGTIFAVWAFKLIFGGAHAAPAAPKKKKTSNSRYSKSKKPKSKSEVSDKPKSKSEISDNGKVKAS